MESAGRSGQPFHWPSFDISHFKNQLTSRPCRGDRTLCQSRFADPLHAAHRHGVPLRRRGVRHLMPGTSPGGTGPLIPSGARSRHADRPERGQTLRSISARASPNLRRCGGKDPQSLLDVRRCTAPCRARWPGGAASGPEASIAPAAGPRTTSRRPRAAAAPALRTDRPRSAPDIAGTSSRVIAAVGTNSSCRGCPASSSIGVKRRRMSACARAR